MALPVTITGINLTVACGGPYKSAAGNYYFFGRDGTTATTLQAFKSTAPDVSWASIATKTGFTTAILNVQTYQFGDVIHILVQDGTASTLQATKYVSFNMANDTFLATTETVSAAASVTGATNVGGFTCSLVVRSSGEVVAFYNGVSTKTSSTLYSRVYYRRRTGVNTYGTETEVDAVTAVNNSLPIAVLGAADRVHFLFAAAGLTGLRTLSAANALNTYATNAQTPPGDAVSYDRAGTTKVVITTNATAQGTFYFDSSDNPTVNTASQSIAAATIPHRIGVDTVNDDVTICYRSSADSDLYVIKSSNDGVTFGAPVSAFVGTVASADANLSRSPSGSMYTRVGNVVVGYVVNDNGTLKYNEFIVRAILNVGSASGAGASNVVGASIAADAVTAAGIGDLSVKGETVVGKTVTAAGVGGSSVVGETIVAAVGSRILVSWVEVRGTTGRTLTSTGVAGGTGTSTVVAAPVNRIAVSWVEIEGVEQDAAGAAAGAGVAAGTGATAFAGTAIRAATATATATGATAATGNSFAAGTGTATGAGATTITGQAVAGRTVTAGGVGASNVINRSFYATIGLSSGIGAGGATGAYIFGVAVTAAGIGGSSVVGGQLGVNVLIGSGLGSSAVVGASTAATNGVAAGVGASSVKGSDVRPTSSVSAGFGACTATGFSFAASTSSAAGTSTAAATGNALLARTVTATGTGASSFVGGQLGVNVLIGTGLGVATASGASTAATTGTAAGVGSTAVLGTNVKHTVAAAAGLGAGTVTGFSFVARTVTTAGVGATSITGLAIFAGKATAAGVGASAVQGGQLGVNVLIGAGLGTGAAIGASTAATTATSAGVGAATAPGTNVKPASATAAGLAASTVTGRSFAAGTFLAAGTGTASTTGIAVAARAVTAAGVGGSAVAGGQLGINVAAAAGIGAANFVGGSTAAGVAAAAGVGAAPWTGVTIKSVAVTATGTGTAAASGRVFVAGVATASGLGTALSIAPVSFSAVSLVAPQPVFENPAITLPSSLRLGDRVLDYGLRTLDLEADKIFICNNFPTTYLEATSTYAVGSKHFGQGLVFGAPAAGAPTGRKVISLAVSDGLATTIGTPQCWAVVDSMNSRLLATGPASGFTTVGVNWSWTLEQIPIHMDG